MLVRLGAPVPSLLRHALRAGPDSSVGCCLSDYSGRYFRLIRHGRGRISHIVLSDYLGM